MASDQSVAEDTVPTTSPEDNTDLDSILRLSIPLVGIATSEMLLYVGQTRYALWGHVLTLLVCTLAPLRYSNETTMFGAFALVPLFRLVNLGMPVFFELTVFWFPLIYGPLIPALYLFAKRQTPVLPEANLTRAGLLLVPLALPVSVVLAEVEFRILEPDALIPAWSPLQLALITIVMVGFVGLVEELLFRGVLQRTLQHRLGRWIGLVLTSAVFGLMHSGYGEPAEILFAGVIGLLFGLIYDLTNSIALIAVIHGVLNVFLFAIIPIQGSILVIVLQ